MPLSDPQLEIARDQHRFRVAACGRRFGKTFLARHLIAKYSRYPEQRIWYVAPTYRQAKNILWKPLKTKLKEINWCKRVNETELSLTLVNGTEIALKGADNYDSLRGVGLNFLVMDECADIDSAAWYETLRPMLSDTQGDALFLGTPKGLNWFKDLYDRQITDSANWRSWQFRTIDGGNVPAEEIEQARRDLDTRTYLQEYEASFENFSGRVAYNFDRTQHLIDLPQLPTKVIWIGLDFNVHPMCASVMVVDKDVIYVIDEIRIANSNTLEMVLEIKRRYPNSEIRAYPDPAGSARKTASGGLTDHIILRNNHFKVFAPHSHTPVKDRIAASNSPLMNDRGDIKLFFSKKLKYTIESLERYVYKEDTQIRDKGQYDHMFDALSYAVDYLFPIRRDIQPQPAQRWGVRTQ